MTVLIRRETAGDRASVHALNASAFGRPSEAQLVDALRPRARPLVSLVAADDDAVVGHIMFTPVSLSGCPRLIMGLAPMAVIPARQRAGIGSALVRAGLEQCQRLGAAAAVVLGHPEFYPKFGFSPAARFGIACEYDVPEEAFMVIELAPDALRGASGTVRYHAAFSEVSGGADPDRVHDRQLLLGGAKRNAVLELREVQRYGTDSHGDADYVSVYGMRPAEWYAKGVRLLGRTAVECTRDALGDVIGADVGAVAAMAPPTAGALVVDLFAGSGNTLHWLLRHLPGARGMGFELDASVFRLTRHNVAAVALPIDILNTDYRSGLSGASLAADQLLVTFIAPPWGDALDKASGLDLRRTTPPITEIVDVLLHTFAQNRLLCAIQVYETVEPGSLAELESRFDWSALRVYGLNAPGENHGILLGAKGWTPQPVGALPPAPNRT